MGLNARSPTRGMTRSPTLFFELVANDELAEHSAEKLGESVCKGRSSADSASSLPATALQRSSAEDFGEDAAKATIKAMDGSPSSTEDSSYEEEQQQEQEPYTLGEAGQHKAKKHAAAAQGGPAGPGVLVALAAKPPTAKFADSLQPREILEELLGDLYIDYGRLEMGEVLGAGGFAEVHAAQLRAPLVDFSEPVAVKQLLPHVLSCPDDLREFLMEANLMRKMKHMSIVRLVGVGARDLTDLVTMRETMYAVQEYMAGGDLKELLLKHMRDPFARLYSKGDALRWALQIADAMSYLHSVCKPMVIHRDLKLDNVLLTGGPMGERQAKLADFGLAKRIRKLAGSSQHIPWNQEFSYHGDAYEPSFYGGNKYLTRGTFVSGFSAEPSMHNGNMQDSSMHSAWGLPGVPTALPTRRDYNTLGNLEAVEEEVRRSVEVRNSSEQPHSTPNQQQEQESRVEAGLPPKGPKSSLCTTTINSSSSSGDAAIDPITVGADTPGPCPAITSSSRSSRDAGDGTAAGTVSGAGARDGVQPVDSGWMAGGAGALPVLQSAARAKALGLMEDSEFVAHVLSAANMSGGQPLPDLEEHHGGDKSVHRKLAAAQALERSVRRGNHFFDDQQQQQHTQQQQQAQQQQQQSLSSKGDGLSSSGKGQVRFSATATAAAGDSEITAAGDGVVSGAQLPTSSSAATAAALTAALGSGRNRYINATQKVGSLMYMAPEVLMGNPYNEKIDVFSFGVILYELFSGLILASRVLFEEGLQEAAGEADDEHRVERMQAYAEKVAAGHREPLPRHWPAELKQLVSNCWAQNPADRPAFRKVVKTLYMMKQSGVVQQLDDLGPKTGYDPVGDCGCGCSIM